MTTGRAKVSCDRWRSGVCRVWLESEEIVYCPPARAENCRPGECCHHPLYEVRPLLVELKEAGVKLRRYGSKIKDPEFVRKLHAAFRRVRSKSVKR